MQEEKQSCLDEKTNRTSDNRDQSKYQRMKNLMCI